MDMGERCLADRQALLLLLIFCMIIFVSTLGTSFLKMGDESRVAGISAQMAVYNNWLKPELNGSDFLEKPPLFFWVDALSIKLFGRNSFGARFPSAVSATLAILAVFMSLRILRISQQSSILASIILASSAQFFIYAHTAMIDMMLAVFIALALLVFLLYRNADSNIKKTLYFALFAISLSGALFAKGLVGLAIPGSAIFAWLVSSWIFLKKKEGIYVWAGLFAGSALAFIPVGIWIFLLYRTYGFDAFYTVVWTNNIGRFTGSHAEHVGPFYYYLKKLPEQLQPWTAFLPFAVYYHIIQVKNRKNSISLFFLCWLFIPYLLLTISAGKRQVYVLPLYASEACLIALFLGKAYLRIKNRGIKGLKTLFAWRKSGTGEFININDKYYFAIVSKYASILFVVAGLGLATFAIIVKQDIQYMIIPIILSTLSAIAYFKHRNNEYPKGYACFIISFALLFASIHCNIFQFAIQKQTYAYLFKECKKLEDRGYETALLQPNEGLRGGAVFYMGRKIEEIQLKDLTSSKLNLKSKILVFKSGKKPVLPRELRHFEIIKSFKVKKKYIVILSLPKNEDI